MNTEKQAREAMNHQHHQEKHLHQSMLSRAETEVETSTNKEGIEVEARELMVQQRQQEESLQKSMLSRAESELNGES